MTVTESPHETPWIALFDLDGTLSWHDTLGPFLVSFLKSHPSRMASLWRLPVALAGYAFDRDRGKLKSKVIRMVMRGASRDAVDRCAEAFVQSLKPAHRLRPTALAMVEAHRAAGDRLVL